MEDDYEGEYYERESVYTSEELGAHAKRFPLPQIEHNTLEFKGVSIPLRKEQMGLWVTLYDGLHPSDVGWETSTMELSEYITFTEYKNEASLRQGIAKFLKKARLFEKEGLFMTFKGNGFKSWSFRMKYAGKKRR